MKNLFLIGGDEEKTKIFFWYLEPFVCLFVKFNKK